MLIVYITLICHKLSLLILYIFFKTVLMYKNYIINIILQWKNLVKMNLKHTLKLYKILKN